MLTDVDVPILIVGYRNPDDIVVCLSALTKLRTAERFCVMICENGGPEAFDRLMSALISPLGPCVHERMGAFADKRIKRAAQLLLEPIGAPVFVAEANENLGFAGGVNAWLRPLLVERGWKGVWVLNPDTWPEPDALSELVRAAEERGKGLIGSRVMFPGRTDIGSSRGLRWRKLGASTEGVDIFAPVDPRPDPADVEARIESPSGVSLYATRACLEFCRTDGRAILPLFRRFRLGRAGQGQLRDRLRARLHRSACRRQLDRRSPIAGQTLAACGLSNLPQPYAFREATPPALVLVDRSRQLP